MIESETALKERDSEAAEEVGASEEVGTSEDAEALGEVEVSEEAEASEEAEVSEEAGASEEVETSGDTEALGEVEAPGEGKKGEPWSRKKKLTVAALAAAGVILAAAIVLGIMLIADRPEGTAEDLVRALISGDGEAAVELLPEKVIEELAREAAADVDETRRALAESLGAAVEVYAPAPTEAQARAGKSRAITGEELEALRDTYGQIGLTLRKAAAVDVAVGGGTVPVRAVKLGPWWYADYTAIEDTAYAIAYLGPSKETA